MTTFEIRYENGATNATMTVRGRDLHDALRNAGIREVEAFVCSRLVTWQQV